MWAPENAPAHGNCQGPGTITRRPFNPYWKFPRDKSTAFPAQDICSFLGEEPGRHEQKLKHEDNTSLSVCCEVKTQKQES